MVAKNMINAVYGMMVTAIIRNEITYNADDTWTVKPPNDFSAVISSYNNNINRFLSYAWGVYVTAHARHNLLSAILALGPDYIYSDTDSVKYINGPQHEAWFTNYNSKIINSLVSASLRFQIPLSKFMPETRKGVKKPLGVFVTEPGYDIFKSDGAKRYIYVESDTKLYNFTVSGVSKRHAMPFLLYTKTNAASTNLMCHNFLSDHEIPRNNDPAFIQLAKYAYGTVEHGDTIKEIEEFHQEASRFLASLPIVPGFLFMDFGEGLFIPAEFTGSLNSTYIDSSICGILYDYLGKPAIYKERSAVCLSPESFLMHKTQEYRDLLERRYDGSL